VKQLPAPAEPYDERQRESNRAKWAALKAQSQPAPQSNRGEWLLGALCCAVLLGIYAVAGLGLWDLIMHPTPGAVVAVFLYALWAESHRDRGAR
jgi:hypothetical protein